MKAYQYELAGCLSDEAYENAIPPCCALRTVEQHIDTLMGCWGLALDIEEGHSRNCDGCEFATRKAGD